jgi:hypothetical protein
MTATRNVLGAIATAAAAVAAWWVWLGWDAERRLDPVTQVESGPFEAWQVVGFVLTLVLLAVLAALVVAPWLVAPAMTLAVTGAWSVWAAGGDDSGLWVVGAVAVFLGSAVGSTVVCVTVWAIRRAFRGRRDDRPQRTVA